jgi:hypothetical protein
VSFEESEINAESVVKKHRKYLMLIALLILLGCGAYFFEGYIVPISELVVWVLFVAGAIALGEKIVGRLLASRRS